MFTDCLQSHTKSLDTGDICQLHPRTLPASSPATGVSSSQLIKRPGPRVHILVTSPLLTSIRVSYGLSLEYVSAAICGSAPHRLSYQLSIYHRETTTLYNIPAALSSQLNWIVVISRVKWHSFNK